MRRRFLNLSAISSAHFNRLQFRHSAARGDGRENPANGSPSHRPWQLACVSTPESDISEVAKYAQSMTRRGKLDALTSFAESSPEILAGITWRAGKGSRAAFDCEGLATPSVARNPRPSGSRASCARHALRQRSWLAKDNQNPMKIHYFPR